MPPAGDKSSRTRATESYLQHPAPSPVLSSVRTAQGVPAAQAPRRWPVAELESHSTAPVSPSSHPPGPGFRPVLLLPLPSALTLRDPSLMQASYSVVRSHDQSFPWACTVLVLAPGWRTQLGAGQGGVAFTRWSHQGPLPCLNATTVSDLSAYAISRHLGRCANPFWGLEMCHLQAF
ncbi:hypothetical protein HJG60_011583 [Phyllostomus discolor]|uniref:Uncharacterized protein n=1 Tax=Phyllostomus discolor TaxID=89673 RepID=A0A833ZZ97_9CHIR|nr:hypothetical protein HJG60_011583 [Phyllostomus discolor]